MFTFMLLLVWFSSKLWDDTKLLEYQKYFSLSVLLQDHKQTELLEASKDEHV
jgi:hypothetical protein